MFDRFMSLFAAAFFGVGLIMGVLSLYSGQWGITILSAVIMSVTGFFTIYMIREENQQAMLDRVRAYDAAGMGHTGDPQTHFYSAAIRTAVARTSCEMIRDEIPPNHFAGNFLRNLFKELPTGAGASCTELSGGGFYEVGVAENGTAWKFELYPYRGIKHFFLWNIVPKKC